MRKTAIFVTILFLTFIVDQAIKQLVLDGFRFSSDCISITLVFNKGVAFSMFSFIGEYLKSLQILLLIVAAYVVYKNDYFQDYYIALGIFFGAAIANITDRFFHEGVVDYVYWHCGFDFAIFNFADAMIDLAIVLIFLRLFYLKKRLKSHNS